jgi:regulatory protein
MSGNYSKFSKSTSHSPSERPKRMPRSARNKMMDYLARRDHSELELKQKLKKHLFTETEIEKALTYGRENGWLPNTEEQKLQFAERVSAFLHRKNKGTRYINKFLKQKGLPAVKSNSDQELEKALDLVQSKFKKSLSVFHTIKENAERKNVIAKIGRFLISRGYQTETINLAIKKVLK